MNTLPALCPCCKGKGKCETTTCETCSGTGECQILLSKTCRKEKSR